MILSFYELLKCLDVDVEFCFVVHEEDSRRTYVRPGGVPRFYGGGRAAGVSKNGKMSAIDIELSTRKLVR